MEKSEFQISDDIKKYETEETIKCSVSVLNNLKGKTTLEIDRICQTIKSIAKENAKL